MSKAITGVSFLLQKFFILCDDTNNILAAYQRTDIFRDYRCGDWF
jgi:hypothetical protein